MANQLFSKAIASLNRLSRPQVVWVCLIGSMTTVGGLLLALEGERAPRMDGLALAATPPAAGATPIEAIYRTRSAIEEGSWQGIVIHHSGSLHGSAATVASEHEARGLAGLGHHFVIGNGSGSEDGELHVGYRWLEQLPGAHTGGPQQDMYNRRYVGVCLIGDGDRRGFSEAQLARVTRLVRSLQSRLGLDPEQVVLHRDVAATTSPGRAFPEASFRASLLGPGERPAADAFAQAGD